MFLRSLVSSFKKCGKNKGLVKIKMLQLLMENEENTSKVPVAIASTSNAPTQAQMIAKYNSELDDEHVAT